MRKQNQCRKKLSSPTLGAEDQKEWLEAFYTANNLILESKRDQWWEFLTSKNLHQHPDKMWQTISSLSRTSDTKSPNDAHRVNGKTITSLHEKSKTFESHYPTVNLHNFTGGGHALNLNKKLDAPVADDETSEQKAQQALLIFHLHF